MDRTLACGFRVRILPNESDVMLDMALAMIGEIRKNQLAGKPTVLIVPVGPTGQYPIFARLVNEWRLSLRDVHFFNMDEYLDEADSLVGFSHPMSFRASMQRDLWDKVDPELTVPAGQRFFPEPGREAWYDDRIASFGGAGLCLGGLGINGHIAFNEPPEPGESVSAERYAQLPTRVLEISRETRTVNAIGYQRGDIRGMPRRCITVGMKPILDSREVYIAINRPWQHGILRRVLLGEPQAAMPATLLKRRGGVRFCVTEEIAQGLPWDRL